MQPSVLNTLVLLFIENAFLLFFLFHFFPSVAVVITQPYNYNGWLLEAFQTRQYNKIQTVNLHQFSIEISCWGLEFAPFEIILISQHIGHYCREKIEPGRKWNEI